MAVGPSAGPNWRLAHLGRWRRALAQPPPLAVQSRSTWPVHAKRMQRRQRDGRTHLAHKAEHAVDLETGAIVAVTLQGADLGDTTTVRDTLTAAGEQVVAADLPSTVQELIANKGYHSNETMTDCHTLGVRSYISEPDRGRRDWSKAPEAKRRVHANRRRIRGQRGKRLMRRRGELVERTFAHVYETGGMRRMHLRGHQNIYKRLIVHASGFNLGLLMRSVIGVGTPRSLQGRVAALIATIIHVWNLITTMVNPGAIRPRPISPLNS